MKISVLIKKTALIFDRIPNLLLASADDFARQTTQNLKDDECGQLTALLVKML